MKCHHMSASRTNAEKNSTRATARSVSAVTLLLASAPRRCTASWRWQAMSFRSIRLPSLDPKRPPGGLSSQCANTTIKCFVWP